MAYVYIYIIMLEQHDRLSVAFQSPGSTTHSPYTSGVFTLSRALSSMPRGVAEEVLACDWSIGLTTSVPTRHLHGRRRSNR